MYFVAQHCTNGIKPNKSITNTILIQLLLKHLIRIHRNEPRHKKINIFILLYEYPQSGIGAAATRRSRAIFIHNMS